MRRTSPQPYVSTPPSSTRPPPRHSTGSLPSPARQARTRHTANSLTVDLSSNAYPSTTRALTPQLADSPLHYSDDDQLHSDTLGDLTPTSNQTPSPRSAAARCGDDSAPSSPSSVASSASSIMSLPPLSIPPRVLDALHREVAEKSQLLSLANDHIQHQSVAIQHLQAKLTSYQEANNAMLSANVAPGAGSSGGRSEEVKQLKVLVSHLYNMIAQRDAIVEEQEKELHYYQQLVRQVKHDREKEVEKDREKEKERDRERERIKQLELEVSKLKEKEREREERKEQERRERETEKQKEEEGTRRRQEDDKGERLMKTLDERSSSPALQVQTSSPPPPVPPPPLRTSSSPVPSITVSVASNAAHPPRPLSITASPLLASASSSSPHSANSSPTMTGFRAPSPGTPLSASASASSRQSPHGLLPKVRRASPMSASASSSPTLGGAAVPVMRSSTPPLMSLSADGASVMIHKRSG